MILLTHGFSRRNAGDGLLVDLTLAYLRRAGADPSKCVLFALDPESFPRIRTIRAPGEPDRKLSWRLLQGAGQIPLAGLTRLTRGHRPFGALAETFAEAEAVVGVGGGYLRAGSLVESGGMLVNHLTQLVLAGTTAAPSVYLPQSIGPLQGPAGRLLGRSLARIDRVYVRDDTSLAEAGRYADVVRAPDLAVMHIAETLGDRTPPSPERVVLVARDLGRNPGYLARLRSLVNLLSPEPEWAVQSDVLGAKSDRVFYRRLGVESSLPLSESLDQRGPGVVISVRLHGALQAILAGWPAIHLSYQRKGWGAYRDLGLGSLVHDARRFDPSLVARQTHQLMEHPEDFWDRLWKARPALIKHSEQIVADLSDRLAVAPRKGG